MSARDNHTISAFGAFRSPGSNLLPLGLQRLPGLAVPARPHGLHYLTDHPRQSTAPVHPQPLGPRPVECLFVGRGAVAVQQAGRGEGAGPDPAGHEHDVRAGSVPVGVIGEDDRSLSAAHGPRFLAEEMDLEVVGQGAEQLQGAEDVEQLDAIEEHDDASWRRGSSMVTLAPPPRAH